MKLRNIYEQQHKQIIKGQYQSPGIFQSGYKPLYAKRKKEKTDVEKEEPMELAST